MQAPNPVPNPPPEMSLSKLWYNVTHSITLKIFSMAFLLLFSMIPVAFIRELVRERQGLQNQASEDISQKWAGAQTVSGPILTLPYKQLVVVEHDKKKTTETVVKRLHLLPSQLAVNGQMEPKSLYRGIYEMMVYTAHLKVQGSFEPSQFSQLPVNPKDILWDKAYLSVGLNDLRGIKDAVQLRWGAHQGVFDPGTLSDDLFSSGIHKTVPLRENTRQSKIPFQFELNLKGNQRLYFVPVGKETKVNLQAPWGSPSFDGAFLPDQRDIKAKENSFQASWKVLHLNRNFPQIWEGKQYDFSNSAFGVYLMQPVDHYQKVERVVKYALFFIGLTFLTFFFVELITRRMVHPLQYILVGFALCVFYTLLLSISEHLGFEKAYGIAASMTVVLITSYAAGFLKSLPLTAVTGGVLVSLYSFIYVTIYQEDYALLMGSLGMFVVLALVMFFSRKIDLLQVQAPAQT